MAQCPRCEALPDQLPQSGKLYIAPPIHPTGADIRSMLDQLGYGWNEAFPNIYEVEIGPGDLHNLCSGYLCNLSTLEMGDTKTLILPEGETADIYHLTKMEPLSALVSKIQGEWLLGILREERVKAHFQAIVHCDDPARVFAYEALIRGLDELGGIIPPFKMFQVAKSADLLFNLDRTARVSIIRDFINLAEDTVADGANLFINFNPTTIYNPRYCLQTTFKAIQNAKLDPSQIVFEVVESEQVKDTEHLLDVLKYYREHGFRVALDDMGAGYSSLNLLHKLQPDFIKLDMELIRDVDTIDYKGAIAKNLLSLAKDLNVEVIAEGVETVGEWQWLKEHGANYVQGFLFSKPANPPAAVTLPGGTAA